MGSNPTELERMKKIKWKKLGRNRNILWRQKSRLLKRKVRFFRTQYNKRYRFLQYLRKSFMIEQFGIKKVSHQKKLDLTNLVNQLAYRLYADYHVRSYRQGVHYIKLGIVKVDGNIIKKPSFIVGPGSIITVDIHKYKDINISNILINSPKIKLEKVNPRTENLIPRAIGKNKKIIKSVFDAIQN